MKRHFLPAFVLLALAMPCANAADTPPYRQKTVVPLQGDDRWDYLAMDTTAHRLYISRGTHVSVLDTNTNALLNDIPNTQGVHGIAFAPDLGKAFVSNGKDNSVSVIDTATLKETARVAVGRNPDAVLFEPVTRRVFAFNGKDGTATVIDARSNAVVKTIPIGGKLEFAATDGKGNVFDNVEDKNEMTVIDAATMRVTDHWKLTGCTNPTGLAIDAAANRLFTACDNGKLAVIDARSGRLVATPAIGNGPDAVVFDGKTGNILTSNGEDGTITVLHEDSHDKYSEVATVPTQKGARTMALDPASHRVYLITAQFADTPAATPANPLPAIVPGSVVLLVYEPE